MTAVAFEAERWYADKGRRVVAVDRLDALGRLEIVRMTFADGGAALYSLVPDDVGWATLLRGARGRFTYSGRLPGGDEQRLDVDQSHSSWRVGGSLVKCYRRLASGIHPEVELLRALSTRSFAHSPAYVGALEWESPEGESVAVVVVEEFVGGSEEGWDWVAELAAAGEASFAEELGLLTRELHATLADVLPTRPATAADTAEWRRDAEAQLTRAIAVAPSLADQAPRVRRELERLGSAAETTQLARVHGDLHVGQFLRAGERLVIVDFEGQPAKSVEDRRALQTQLRDLASLARSLDHCGRYAVARSGADRERTEAWIAEARTRLISGYGPSDRILLRALEWERAIYEFTYAATYLPEWMYAPRGGFEALLREAEA